ncbi:type I-B CRISPR-associated protein Cas5b [Marinicrinis sediminis]|uniref:Type I-B CRISPR-associated protein Cas5b n=1 Tax=Marinicrinis sediminis TaxID=1652465 RepID=A0ABW5R7K5_9BACL
MMKALRLKLYQQTACYKKPFAFKVSETYPLPPHSTVKGMLHAVLEAKTLIPMEISIQGQYDTMSTDYQTHYFFKKSKTNEFALTADGLGVSREYNDITTMPIYMHMLYNVELLIHVHADEQVLQQLKHAILTQSAHLSLGRWEDLVRVDECEIVNLTVCNEEPELKYAAYVPKANTRRVSHFPYKLNWTYRIVNGVRVWDKLHVGYMQAGQFIRSFEGLYIDAWRNEQPDTVFFPST